MGEVGAGKMAPPRLRIGRLPDLIEIAAPAARRTLDDALGDGLYAGANGSLCARHGSSLCSGPSDFNCGTNTHPRTRHFAGAWHEWAGLRPDPPEAPFP